MRYVIFIDGDNISPTHVPRILRIIKQRGKIIFSKVYGDFSEQNMKIWKENCITYNIEPIQVWRKSGKNSSDIKISQDCVHTLYNNNMVDHFVLVTGDGDFTSVVSDLKRHEKYVIAMANGKSTSRNLKNACDEYINLKRVVLPFSIIKDKINELLTGQTRNISYLKDKLLQNDSTFNESNYGKDTFKELLISLGYEKRFIRDSSGRLYIK